MRISVAGRTLGLCCAIAACSDAQPPRTAAQRAVLPGAVLPGAAHAEAATFAEMVGELGIHIEPDVPEADAESLQRLMSRSGYQIKSIRRVAPGRYTIHVWGVIPQAASEFTLEREGDSWKMAGDTPWVLIGLLRISARS